MGRQMTKPSETPRMPQNKLRDKILAERKKGNVVFWGLPGQLQSANLDDFVKQPADGILYDLNRLEEVCMTFLDDPKWVNDFAVALTIRKLKDMLAAATTRIAELKSEVQTGDYWGKRMTELRSAGADHVKWRGNK